MTLSAVQSRARELVAQCASLVRIPRDYPAIRRVFEDPNGTSLQITQAIDASPELSAALLRLLSGPLHALAEGGWNTTRAVNQLGMQRVLDLSLVALLPQALYGLGGALVRSDYWRRAIRIGLAARLIADTTARSERDRMFCSGMLVPIGLPVLWHAAGGAMQQVERRKPAAMNAELEEERRQAGTDHLLVSAALARHWQLPPPIQRALAACDEPARAVPHHLEAAILKLARWAACTLPGVESPDPLAVDMLDLDPRDLSTITSDLERQFPTYADLLSIPSSAPPPASR